MQNNTESSQGRSELVRYEIGTISTVDLVDSPVTTHMETEEHGGGADGGVDHAGSGVTLGHKTIQLGQSSEMERIDLEFKAPVVKPNNMDVSESVRIEEGVIKAVTDATFNPNINFTAGSERQLHVGIGNARANKARGRSKNTKNLPQVTKQKMQRQTEANANVGEASNSALWS
nr:hypothetical protein CFP56_28321 [Quercus suber]